DLGLLGEEPAQVDHLLVRPDDDDVPRALSTAPARSEPRSVPAPEDREHDHDAQPTGEGGPGMESHVERLAHDQRRGCAHDAHAHETPALVGADLTHTR